MLKPLLLGRLVARARRLGGPRRPRVSRRRHRHASPTVLITALGLSSSGCASWMDGGTLAGLDTQGRGSVEQRVGLGIAMGQSSRRVYTEVGMGDQISTRNGAQAYTLTGEAGYEGGDAVRVAAGLEGKAMIGGGDRLPAKAAVGPTGQVLFRVYNPPTHSTQLYIGPRIALDVSLTDKKPAYPLASLGLVFRWMFGDSTTETHPLPYCAVPDRHKRG